MPRPTPLPIPPEAASILLVGGSFDPPHRGHTQLAASARQAVLPDGWVVFVPAGHAPLKPAGPVAGGPQRCAMTRLATEAIPRAAVWTEEIDRPGPGPSYWVDTLEAARAQVGPGCDLRFLIGTDQLLALPRWRQWRRILALAEPVVVLRQPLGSPEDVVEALAGEAAWEGEPTEPWRGRIVTLPLLPFSSTRIRGALTQGLPDADLHREGVDPAVLAYIRAHGLYAPGGARADLISGPLS